MTYFVIFYILNCLIINVITKIIHCEILAYTGESITTYGSNLIRWAGVHYSNAACVMKLYISEMFLRETAAPFTRWWARSDTICVLYRLSWKSAAEKCQRNFVRNETRCIKHGAPHYNVFRLSGIQGDRRRKEPATGVFLRNRATLKHKPRFKSLYHSIAKFLSILCDNLQNIL